MVKPQSKWLLRLTFSLVAMLATPHLLHGSDTSSKSNNVSAQSESSDKSEADVATSSLAPLHWRKDPTIRRRPGSYLGGSLNYAQSRTWLEATDDHEKLAFGPMHSIGTVFRVGDALWEFFCLGFQIQAINAKRDSAQISAFTLMLDISFYPWKGLGIRPSVGFGFGFAQGKEDWEFGFGGPGTLAMAVLYEIRLTRKLTLAPVVQATWLTGEGYDSLFILTGLEFIAWFDDAKKK